MNTKHPTDNKSWIIYGSKGCGKTRNAQALANMLGLNFIRDNWTPRQETPATDHLFLTQERPIDHMYRRVMSFDEAIRRLHTHQ